MPKWLGLDAGDEVARSLEASLHSGSDAPLPRAIAANDVQFLAREAERRPGPVTTALVARAAEDAGDRERAIEELTALVRVLPDRGTLHRERGRLCLALGRVPEAIDAYRAAVQREPSDAEAWHGLASALGASRDWPQALAAAQRAVDAAEGAGARPSRALWMDLGAALDRNERFAEARDIYRRLLAETPDDANLLNHLAWSLDKNHELRKALEVYRRIVALRPNSTSVHVCIAWLLSGSDRASCPACAAVFRRDPGLIDPDEAARQMLEAARLDAGRAPYVSPTLVEIAMRTGTAKDLAAVMERSRQRAIADDRDDRIATLTKALDKLQHAEAR